MPATPGWSSATIRRVQRYWRGRFERPTSSPRSAQCRVRFCSTYSTPSEGLVTDRASCTAGTTATQKTSPRDSFVTSVLNPSTVDRYESPDIWSHSPWLWRNWPTRETKDCGSRTVLSDSGSSVFCVVHNAFWWLENSRL